MSLPERVLADVLDALDRHGVAPDPRLRLVPSDLPNPYYDRQECTIAAGLPPTHGAGRLQWLMLARMLGVGSVDEAVAAIELQLPFVMAHEVAHHLRDHYGTVTDSEFVEESVANRVGLAFVRWHPEHRQRVGELRDSLARSGAALRRLAKDAGVLARGFRADLGDTLVDAGEISRERLEDLRALAAAGGRPLEAVLDPAAVERARAAQRRSARRLAEHYAADLSEYALFHQEWLMAAIAQRTPPSLAEELAAHVLPRDVAAARREETADMLVALLDHPDGRLALAAAIALAEVDASRLPDLANAGDPVLRAAGAALRADGDALAAMLAGPEREAALVAIAACGDPAATRLVAPLLASGVDGERLAAARAVARHPIAVSALVACLDDPIAAVRSDAADALRRLGPRAAPLLAAPDLSLAATVEAAVVLGSPEAIAAAVARVRGVVAAIDAAAPADPRAAALLAVERRRVAALALRAAGRPEAMDAALHALASGDERLRRTGLELARESLPPEWRDELLALHDGAPASTEPLACDGALGALLDHDTTEAHDMHTTVEKLLFLREAPIFARAGIDDLYALAGEARFRRHRAGEVVFHAGAPADEMLVVVTGRLEVVLDGEVLTSVGARQSVGEMGVLSDEVRSVDVRAAEETAVLTITAATLRGAGARQPELLVGVIAWLAELLRDANRARSAGRTASAR